ncbi:MAG: DUF4270 domain-containing protein, partial [Chlorobi bacterium]|nr:DUF4270 domain-containing protein [Chlorobiota bacterium]
DTIQYYSKAEYNEISIGDIIGEISYTPNIEDSIITIKLSDEFAESFSSLADISTTDEFKDFFHGTYVTSESDGGDGAILKYKLDTLSTINIYYHDAEGEYTFKVGTAISGNVRYNTFEHDYSNSSINLDEETNIQDSVAYIQGMSGLKVIVNFPFIEKLKDLGDIAINRAELIVNTAPSIYTYEDDFPAIDAITISGINADGETFLLPEYYSSAGYISVPYLDGSYKYDIAGYIRDLIEGDVDNCGLLLSINSSYSNMKRSVITTGNNSNRTRLVISYTKL